MKTEKVVEVVWIAMFVLMCLAFAYIISFYKTDGSPVIGSTHYPVDSVKTRIADTQYLEYIRQLGETTDGQNIIEWRWHDYGFAGGIRASKEQKAFMQDLNVTRIRG